MKDLTSSRQVLKKLVIFSVPLILSGLLQQLFNWVDALIIGNFLGETALGGIGATTSLYNLFVTALVGFTSGLSVLFARQSGRGEHSSSAKLLASYAVLLTAVFTVISILGIVFITPVLKLLDTPDVLFDYAGNYLRVIFWGIPFLTLYNTYSAALRGMGNSTVPFAAVLLSSVTNAALDFIFIAFCGFGVSGAAAATVLAQIAMTVYVVRYTVIRHPELRFSPFRNPCGEMTRQGGKYGMPPAVQSSVSSVGNLFLQRFMNGFGEHTVAAITTAYRVDSVLLLPIINFSTAISTLVAQETGAGNAEAAKRIFKTGTAMMSVISLTLTAVILLAGEALLAMFGLTAESVWIGRSFFRSIAVFYVVYGLSMSVKGYLEGISDLLFSSITGICSLGVRILCSYLFAGIWGNMVVAYAEAFSWLFLLAVFALRYMGKRRKRHTGVHGAP